VLTLNPGDNYVESSAIDAVAGYGYFGTGIGPAIIIKVQLSTFTRTSSLTLKAGENAAVVGVTDSSQGFVYFGMDSGQIVKIRLSNFTEAASINPGLGSISTAAIDPIGGFAYFGTNTSPGNIIKIRLSDFTVNATRNISPEINVYSIAIDPSSGYGYIGTYLSGGTFFTPSPAIVLKIRLSDLSNVDQLKLTPGETCVSSAGIDPTNGLLYLGGTCVIQIRLSDFSLRRVLAPAPVTGDSPMVLDPARGVGYIAGNAFFIFRLSDLNEIGHVDFPGHLFGIRSGALDPTTGDVYFTAAFGNGELGSPSQIAQLGPASIPSQDFRLSMNPSGLTVQVGGIGAAYVTLDSNNFSGPVSLTTSRPFSTYASVPSSTLLSPSVAMVANGENSSILTVSVPEAAPASVYLFTVTGTSGGISRSISLPVTVTAGPVDFQLYLSRASSALHPGGSSATWIDLGTHTGFSGTINFTGTVTPSLPNSPRVSISPSSVQENLPAETSTSVALLNVNAGSLTTTGKYEIDLTATSGSLSHTVQYCLLVVPTDVTSFCILANPTRLSLGAGQTRTATVDLYSPPGLGSFPFQGTVNLTPSIASSPPGGTLTMALSTASFNLVCCQPLQSTLTVTATSATLPGDYTIQVTATNGTISQTADLSLSVSAALVPGIPGAFSGDWARYSISATWESTPSTIAPIPEIAQYLNSYGSNLQVAATGGNESAGLLTIGYFNGTQQVFPIAGNTIQESGTLFPWIVGSGLSFNSAATQQFAGADRATTTLSLTKTVGGVTATGTWTWDSQTGILMDYQLKVQGTGNIGTVSGLVHVSISETNLWTPTRPTFTIESSTPFLTARQNSASNTTITLTSFNGFSGNVALTAESLPANPTLSTSVDNAISLSANAITTTTVTVKSSSAGEFIILITATSGRETHTSIIRVTVTAYAPPPSLTITTLSPDPATTGQTVRLNFTANNPYASITATWIDWGDGSKPDLIFNMTSSSMCQRLNPGLNENTCTIAPGDLIYAQRQDPATIISGSIIIFRPFPQNPDYLVVHRVIKIMSPDSNTYDQYTFNTQGDANLVPDPWAISASQIAAVYRYTLSPATGGAGSRYDTHTYNNLGNDPSRTYTIQLNATDEIGSHGYLTASETINDQPPLVAVGNVSPSQILTGRMVTLTLTATDADGTVSSISVNWGDESASDILSGSATSDTHAYVKAGSFSITVTAIDNSGSSSQVSSRQIAVRDSLTPLAPASNILGLAPMEFYSLIGVIAAIIVVSTILVSRQVRRLVRRPSPSTAV